MRFRVAITCVFLAVAALNGWALAEEAQGDYRLRLRFANRREGQLRPAMYLAGEQVPICGTLYGVATGTDDKIDILIRVDLLDGSGKTVKPLFAERAGHCLSFGGSEYNFGVHGNLPTDVLGEHRIRVTVEDQVTMRTATRELLVTVEDSTTFALVHFRTTIDEQLRVPTDVFPVGRRAFVAFGVHGCGIADGKSEIAATLTVADSSRKEIVGAKPIELAGSADQPIYATTGVMKGFMVAGLNQSGNFLLRVKVKDVVSGKEVTGELPIRVVEGAEWPAEEVADKSDAKQR